MRTRFLLLPIFAALVFAAILTACSSGPQGQPGPAGPDGAPGPQGPPGPAAPAATGPGLKATITKVDISADRKVTVSYKLTDNAGNPVSRSVLDANSERFSIARLAVDSTTQYTQWLSYVVVDVKGATFKLNGKDTQPALPQVTGVPVTAADNSGDFKEVGAGQYTYTMKTVLPDGFDKTLTHRVMYQGTRDSRAAKANATLDFVPAGGDVKVTRQVITTDACNKCHDPLVVHGSRYDTKLCVVCHTPQNVEPNSGNVLDFKVMVHKIHDASSLPSVKAGNPYFVTNSNHDFSDVTWPQDVRNCTTCHSGAPNADNWKTAPSRAACGSCHDNIDWTTGKSTIAGKPDHVGGPQKDDSLCRGCHQPDSGQEFDASIVGAHTIQANSKQLKGVNYKIIAASVKAGQKPSVDFQITDNATNKIDPNTMDRIEATYAYPTTDYANRVTENVNSIPAAGAAPFVRAGKLEDLGGGTYRYTFKDALAADARGSAGVALGMFKNTTIKGSRGKTEVVREGSVNPVTYVSMDGSQLVPRRDVVSRDSCNSCHKDLGNPAAIAIHGGTRRNTQYCIMCHNPNANDGPRPGGAQASNIRFAYFIHSLHEGSDRAVPTTFGDNAQAKTAEINYPGDQRNCAKCHVKDTYTLPLPAGVISSKMIIGGKLASEIPATQAICSGCHTGKNSFDSHVKTMTTSDGTESCAVCHGKGKDFDVAKAHAR